MPSFATKAIKDKCIMYIYIYARNWIRVNGNKSKWIILMIILIITIIIYQQSDTSMTIIRGMIIVYKSFSCHDHKRLSWVMVIVKTKAS